MPSVLVMAFRATILLASAVLLPLFAVFGNHLPEVLKAVVDMQQITSTSSVAPVPSKVAFDSPVFRPAVAAANTPQNNATEHTMQGSPPLPASPIATADAARVPSSATMPVSYLAPAEGPNVSVPTSGNNAMPGDGAHSTGAAARGPETRNSAVRGDRGPDTHDYSRDTFRASEDHLRQLGASYYQLECWNNAADGYRFFCKMPIAGQQQFQAFYASDSDPVQAMNIVIHQIETWQAQGAGSRNQDLGARN